MKKSLLFSLLLVLFGCGIQTFKSETKIEKDTTYVPLDIREQILGYTKGDCSDKSLRQRVFNGAVPFIVDPDIYVYQKRLVLNADDTYQLGTRVFKNEIEVGTVTLESGSFAIVDGKIQLQNLGEMLVDLGASKTNVHGTFTTAHGAAVFDFLSFWDDKSVDETPFCP